MTNSENINALIPIFDWSWWQTFMFTFVIGWLAIRLIKGMEPLGWEAPLKKGGRPIYMAGFCGDIFLPIGIASSVVVLKNLDVTNTWYLSRWWNWLGLVLGYITILYLELKGKPTKNHLLSVSKIWHTFISFPLLFYMVFVTTIPLFVSHEPTWALVLAFVGYSIWDFTFYYDVKHPPDYKKTH